MFRLEFKAVKPRRDRTAMALQSYLSVSNPQDLKIHDPSYQSEPRLSAVWGMHQQAFLACPLQQGPGAR